MIRASKKEKYRKLDRDWNKVHIEIEEEKKEEKNIFCGINFVDWMIEKKRKTEG